jgi:hypothetical protein
VYNRGVRREIDTGARIMVSGALLLGQFGCGKLAGRDEIHSEKTPRSSLSVEPPAHSATATKTQRPTPTFTPTPNIIETQKAQWQKLENAERGYEFELTNPLVTRIIRFPWQGGDGYWVEFNNDMTVFQSDCVKQALEDSGKLGDQVQEGIWEPNASINEARGRVKFSSNIAGPVFEPLGIQVPFVDLDEIENGGKIYDCKVTTLGDTIGEGGERIKIGIGEIYEAVRPQLEKVYPRVEQLGKIFGNLLDLIDQSVEEKLTPQP